MAAIATKEQELKALEQIKKIVEGLGPDSYVGTALKGCFADAEDNIANDFALSMYDRWQLAEHNLEIAKAKVQEVEGYNKGLAAENKRLTNQVEGLLKWEPYEDSRNIKQEKYEQLAKDRFTKKLTDAEAAELIHREFGFDVDKIEIIHTVDVYKINVYRQLKKVGELQRDPVYNATDWNYVRFNVCGWAYEMYGGDLHQFM